MALRYSIEHKNSLIEVRLEGVPDRASLTQMWKDIVAGCKEHGCMSILGISEVEQPPRLADAIHLQVIFLEAGVTIDHRIAWVQLNPAAVRMNILSESILLNRGMLNGRLFTDEAEARKWLDRS